MKLAPKLRAQQQSNLSGYARIAALAIEFLNPVDKSYFGLACGRLNATTARQKPRSIGIASGSSTRKSAP